MRGCERDGGHQQDLAGCSVHSHSGSQKLVVGGEETKLGVKVRKVRLPSPLPRSREWVRVFIEHNCMNADQVQKDYGL